MAQAADHMAAAVMKKARGTLPGEVLWRQEQTAMAEDIAAEASSGRKQGVNCQLTIRNKKSNEYNGFYIFAEVDQGSKVSQKKSSSLVARA